MNVRYREAVTLAHGSSASLRTAIAAEHVSRLRAAGDSTGAMVRCDDYLAEYGANVKLLLTRAETALARGDRTRIDGDLAAVRDIAGGRPADKVEDALLSRLEGLAEARRGRLLAAAQHLRRSRACYQSVGDKTAVAILDDDIRIVTAREGTLDSCPSADPTDRSPNSLLVRAEELRLVGRYEQALTALEPALAQPRDPALRFFALEARVRLLRLLRADDEADDALGELYASAADTARPDENLIAARRLERDSAMGAGVEALAAGDHEMLLIRSLIRSGRLAEAERLLPAAEHPRAEPDERHTAEWHLAMAELLLQVSRHTDDPAIAGQAVAHSRQSLQHAAADSAIAIRISALRLLGHTHAERDDMAQAVTAWAAAHRAEESVAALQPTDHVRLRMLHAVPTEFDEQVLWACAQADRIGDARAKFPVVIAMEAAKGAGILPQIHPVGVPVRALPDPGDIAGARRWIRRAVRGMPRSMAIWMLHATQHDVHHVLIERTWRGVRVHHHSRACDRHRLIAAIEAVVECCTGNRGRRLAMAKPGTTEFDRFLAEIARLLGVPAFLDLPEHVTRIAVVAGGELSDVPFALLPCPGTGDTLIGRRYALSILPCLALRAPLHRRSRGQRGTLGEQMLVLHGPDRPGEPITPAAKVPHRQVLGGRHATPARLEAELGTGKYRQLRIDSHGRYGGDPSRAALLLAPAGTDGELNPARFQAMDLSSTGTVCLGACETGMAKRMGRDEQTGFVRAALASGASAVLAARWDTLDDVVVGVLDRFEQLLLRYPRDIALFIAQREADTADGHPTRWAALSLYGDAGHQTHNGPLVRWLRRLRDAVVSTSSSAQASKPLQTSTSGEQ
ncbi:CHAT domain-containing protein [Actinokineospora pegani]|uniref:CHAT domain-containing protein n=1 Tax=Actinokineospora pegani TaxID=2654637 RepID=UPI0018D4553E|nr:CHAT domain-containing protein [Actinokineospora pegani]